jgi:transcription antitermination factor NusG
MSENTIASLTDEQVSKIDAAINAAKQRRSDQPTPSETERPKRQHLTSEERAARDSLRAHVREEKKVAREKARAEKRAIREANARVPHMSKIEKAANRLPHMNRNVGSAFDDLASRLTASELFALAENLQHHVRLTQTNNALETRLSVGQSVTIVSGNPRFVGHIATVKKVQRIRCYVQVQGYEKPVYLFTSDCEPLEATEVETIDESSEQLQATGS